MFKISNFELACHASLYCALLTFFFSLKALSQVDYETVVVLSQPQSTGSTLNLNSRGTQQIEATYQISVGPYTDSQREILNNLNASQRVDFENKRRFVLEHLARILSSKKAPLGLFGYTAQNLKEKHYNYAFNNEQVRLNLNDYGVKEIGLDTNLKTRAEIKANSISKTLEFVNAQVYDNASLIVDANEFGLELVMGKIGGLSKGSKGFMPGIGVGVRLGVSWQEKAVLASLFGVYENFSSPVSPFNILFGEFYKAGAYMGLGSRERVLQNGRGFAPPAGPVEMNSYGDSSSFTLLFNYTLPLPTPLDGFISYTKNLKMVHLARVIIPVPGQGRYPKIKSIFFDLNAMKEIVFNLTESAKKMAEKFKNNSANSCYQLISN